jgi:hypothetical protein
MRFVKLSLAARLADGTESTWSYSVEKADLNGCRWEIGFRSDLDVRGLAGTDHDSYSVQLQDLEAGVEVISISAQTLAAWTWGPDLTILRGDKEGFKFSALTEGKKNLVSQRSTLESAGRTIVLPDKNQSWLNLQYFTDKDMAQRVANAMAHAIKLCKAKPEPF